ncbi:MAG: hypothetical protein ABI881_07015 [Betaproteobacteria bacterium]
MSRRWLITWTLAIAAVLAAAILFEVSLRERGYVPTVQDDQDLWSLQADRLKHTGNPIALLGASRIQFAVDPARVEKATGRTTAMLAINGEYPVAALRWLAADPSFHGLAIIGVDARGLDRRHWEMQQPWIDHYQRRWTFARKVHRLLLSPLQQYLVFMRSPFAWVALARRELAGQGMPFNDYLVMRWDRVGFLDYRRTNIEAIRHQRIVDLIDYYRDYPPAPPKRWLDDLRQVSAWVEAIQARGGKVVFFREPSGGEHLALDEQNYPRGQYWDAYARVSPATMIEFRDEPEFAKIVLPDSSHIDGLDVQRFTDALLAVLARRGIITTVSQ